MGSVDVEPFLPDEADLKIVRDSARRILGEASDLNEWAAGYFANHTERIAFDVTMTRTYANRGDRILELGSLPLLLTASLQSLGYTVAGVDAKPERMAGAIEALGLDIARCDIETEQLPFGDESHDLAVFNELFEHLRIDPIFTMSEVCRVLRPDGMLLLSTPNLRSLRGIYNYLVRNRAYSCSAELYEEYRKLHTLGHMGHVREYTSAEVVEFLEKVGFVVKGMVFRGKFGRRWVDWPVRFVPRLKPFVSFVAQKGER